MLFQSSACLSDSCINQKRSMLTYQPQEYVKHMCLDMDLSLRTSFSIFALVISIPFIHF